MVVTTVMVDVKPEHVDAFISETIANHEQAIQEEGNLRFDVLQSDDDKTKFLLYEAYATEDNAAAHKDTAHYKSWRDTVAEWMAEPRTGIKYTSIKPE